MVSCAYSRKPVPAFQGNGERERRRVGTGYSIHILRSPSVKAGRHRLSHEPAFWEYVIWRDRRLRATLILSTQLRYTHATKHDWGRSSVGRAPPLHGGGQGFESPRLHSQKHAFCRKKCKILVSAAHANKA